MVIIRINGSLRADRAKDVVEGIHNQARAGVIVVPNFCEVLHRDPADEEIQVVYESTRVAELEAELAMAMKYITAEKDCSTCKQFDKMMAECEDVCDDCTKEACFCRTCHDGSKWEWRGAYGRD